ETGNRDIWLFEPSRGSNTRFTFHPASEGYPVWSPDGRRVAFNSLRNGAYDLYQKEVSGAREEELLLKTAANKYPTGWSPDGRWLVYHELDPKTGSDLWVFPVGGSQPKPWLQTAFQERNARFSPTGQWVAYDSDESGRYEVYVRPFLPSATSGSSKW